MPILDINISDIAEIRAVAASVGNDFTLLYNSIRAAMGDDISNSAEVAEAVAEVERELLKRGISMTAADKKQVQESVVGFSLQILKELLIKALDLFATHSDQQILDQVPALEASYEDRAQALLEKLGAEIVARTPAFVPAPTPTFTPSFAASSPSAVLSDEQKRLAKIERAKAAMYGKSKLKQ